MFTMHGRFPDEPAVTRMQDIEPLPPPWAAELELRFARDGMRTVLASARHQGPLRVQRVLHPEGDAAECLLLHPPGGIAGGDRLRIDLAVGAGAHVLVSTPGSGRWYRSAGRRAYFDIALRVDTGAQLEWLPQESVLFREADATQSLDMELRGGAALLGWDMVQLGRLAAGESWDAGRLQQTLSLRRDGHCVWHEHAAFAAGDAVLDAPTGLAGRRVSGTLWAASPALARAPEAALEHVREVLHRTGAGLPARGFSVESDLCAAATWLAAPADLLLVRALGSDVETLRRTFEAAWEALRPPVLGRAARRPRIWAT